MSVRLSALYDKRIQKVNIRKQKSGANSTFEFFQEQSLLLVINQE